MIKKDSFARKNVEYLDKLKRRRIKFGNGNNPKIK